MSFDDPHGYKSRLARIGVTQKDLAEQIGWSPARMFRIVSGERKRLSGDEERALERALGELEKQASGRSDDTTLSAALNIGKRRPTISPASADLRKIPVYGYAAAGPSGPIHLDHDAVVDHVERVPAQGVRNDVFALEVWNESMSPRYEAGELVYCVRNRRPARGRDVVVELKSGDAWLKRYVGERDGIVFTRQLNPEDEVRFKIDEIRALHAVVGRS